MKAVEGFPFQWNKTGAHPSSAVPGTPESTKRTSDKRFDTDIRWRLNHYSIRHLTCGHRLRRQMSIPQTPQLATRRVPHISSNTTSPKIQVGWIISVHALYLSGVDNTRVSARSTIKPFSICAPANLPRTFVEKKTRHHWPLAVQSAFGRSHSVWFSEKAFLI